MHGMMGQTRIRIPSGLPAGSSFSRLHSKLFPPFPLMAWLSGVGGGLPVDSESDEERGFDLANSLFAEGAPEGAGLQRALVQAGDLFTLDHGRLR